MSHISTRRKVRNPYSPGTASDFIRPFAVKRGNRVVLYCRISWDNKHKDKKLDRQERALRRAVERAGGTVVEVVRETGSGYFTGSDWLEYAAALAEDHGATILALTRNRFIRRSKHNWSGAPTVEAYYHLRDRTAGMTLQTLADPDATEAEQKSLLTKLGRKETGNTGGRRAAGYKKERREGKRPRVLRMVDAGLPIRSAAKKVKVPESTARLWVRSFSGSSLSEE